MDKGCSALTARCRNAAALILQQRLWGDNAQYGNSGVVSGLGIGEVSYDYDRIGMLWFFWRQAFAYRHLATGSQAIVGNGDPEALGKIDVKRYIEVAK